MTADVLVVGAGASGGVAAAYLAEAGLQVVCLEQGQWPDRASYPGARREWELLVTRAWSSSPNVRRRPEDYPVDVSESEMAPINFNGVGGGTVLYAAQWPRLTPSDFRVGTEDGVAADWPLSYEELEPYYRRTDAEIGVSGLAGNPAYPPGNEPPLPPLPVGAAGLRVARGLHRLGWHWWPETNAIVSVGYDGRHPCVQRGTCGSGCNEGAKSSTDLTHWPRALAAGARLVTGARVRRLTVGPDGLVSGAEWVDRSGALHFEAADVVLCAANGIGTPRLLLLSELANSSGLVGRGLMLHPYAMVTGLFDEPLASWRGHNGGLVQSMQFYGTQPGADFVRGARWSLSPTGGPMRAATGRSVQQWGDGHHRHVRERLGRSASFCVLAEDLPEAGNRVTLSAVDADTDGLPAPKLTYRISENTHRILAFNTARAAEALEAAGAWKVESSRSTTNGHFMGTARMGDDPATSVVDRWGMSHDVPNLGVVDGSVFVTAGAANPTSTICALALRTAEHLVRTRRDRRPPRRAYPVAVGSPTTSVPVPVPEAEAEPLPPTARRLGALADVLIPPDGEMPAASEVGGWEGVLRLAPELSAPLQRALDVSPVEGGELVHALSASDPEACQALLTVVAGAYYLDESVRRALGYPGQEPHPVNAREFPEYAAEGLLDGVPRPVGVG